MTILVVLVTMVMLVIGVSTTWFLVDAAERRSAARLAVAGKSHHGRGSTALGRLILIAIVYIVLLRWRGVLTGIPMLDGSLGVALGLYICSRPAASAVDLLFFERYLPRQFSSNWYLLAWLGLNLLTLLAGWVVLYTGLARLVG